MPLENSIRLATCGFRRYRTGVLLSVVGAVARGRGRRPRTRMYGQTSFADDSVPARSQAPHLTRVLRAEVTEMARIDGENLKAPPGGAGVRLGPQCSRRAAEQPADR